MDILIKRKLNTSLQHTPAVRITTEIDSLVNLELRASASITAATLAWNQIRMSLEYEDGRRKDPSWAQRIIMNSLTHRKPRAINNFLKKKPE